jgi:DNA invertase Pin-like site-specific DNA recombinase
MSTTISDVATRSGLTAIREAARKGEVQRIYVATPDRLSRNREECAAILKEFHDSAVDVVFASREWVTTVNRNEGSAGSALDDLIRAIFDRCGTESIMV